jgi:hypothetical protein
MSHPVTLRARCPVQDCFDFGKPRDYIVIRKTLYEMFDPDGSDRIFLCETCGNVFAPTPAEKEKIQRGLAQGIL